VRKVGGFGFSGLLPSAAWSENVATRSERVQAVELSFMVVLAGYLMEAMAFDPSLWMVL